MIAGDEIEQSMITFGIAHLGHVLVQEVADRSAAVGIEVADIVIMA